MFLIFIPLFLLIPCIVYLMDLSLRPTEKYGWDLEIPDFGLAPRNHTGVTSHMRAIQLNPRFVQARRSRPRIAQQFPIRRIVHA
jgi:hypothetical protein